MGTQLEVADPRDIACMKIQAIGDRGSRRDFVALYVVAREYGLREIFQWFIEKYAAVSYSRTHYLKALTFLGSDLSAQRTMGVKSAASVTADHAWSTGGAAPIAGDASYRHAAPAMATSQRAEPARRSASGLTPV